MFAGQDLYHPDGKSGIVYNQNDLVAVATTDKNGDASFLAYTEKPGTRLDDDGNIKPLEGLTGPENCTMVHPSHPQLRDLAPLRIRIM